MFDLIGSLFSLIFDLVRMVFTLAGDMLEFAFGILGGIFSLLVSLGGLVLTGALVLVAIFRRKDYKKQRAQSCEADSTRADDVDDEEFVSFYDQFRTEQQ